MDRAAAPRAPTVSGDGLNPIQREAVRHLDGPCLVLAGAGSGKTRVICHKIAYLLREAGYAPRHISAVTFTNKAAREMKGRIREIAGEAGRGLQISTFHTLGLKILKRELARVGRKAGFSLYDEGDAEALVSELMRRHSAQFVSEPARLRGQISRWKNAFVLPEATTAEATDDPIRRQAAALYADYERMLRAYNAFDLDDLLLAPVCLFRRDAECLGAWRERIRYLLVDEYQDTNATQYELVKLLMGERGRFTVVGDDDQSIYSWRGAQPENLRQLLVDFPNLKVVKLEQNYRSTGNILRAANALIAQNPHVFEKRLWSELGLGDRIRVLAGVGPEDEARKVVSHIQHQRVIKGVSYGDFAILYRSNHQAREFEQILREYGIPYLLSGGLSFFSYAEIRDAMAYLRLIANPDDDAAFLRIVNTPRREIGPATLERLATYAVERQRPLFACLFELGCAAAVGERAATRLQAFGTLIGDLAERAPKDTAAQIVDAVLTETGYVDWLATENPEPLDLERRLGNIQTLSAWLQRMEENAGGSVPLADLLQRLQLIDLLERREEEEAGDRLSLMTLHAAKGLEFPHVFLVGMEEEILPHRVSMDEGSVEEERRLAYVGITRAQRTLTLSYVKRRRRYGEDRACEPSRFLGELPVELLEGAVPGGATVEEPNREMGRDTLAGLRRLLDQP